jgi:hypothetical protein
MKKGLGTYRRRPKRKSPPANVPRSMAPVVGLADTGGYIGMDELKRRPILEPCCNSRRSIRRQRKSSACAALRR